MAPVGQAELSAGRAALDRGDWAAARSVFADLVLRDDEPDALYGLARALEWEGSYGAAVRCYERALRATGRGVRRGCPRSSRAGS